MEKPMNGLGGDQSWWLPSTGMSSFRDHTGDRRFWVVDLGHRVIDTGKISKDRDRIWKAAIAQFRQGLSPCLSHAEQSSQ
jgi:predicted P-loop ATPase